MNTLIEMFNKKEDQSNISAIKTKKDSKSGKRRIEANEQFIPDDEKKPLKLIDPDDLPEDDPYENPEDAHPDDGEGS